MSLKDNKEPANVYQALQPSGNNAEGNTKGNGQSVEYQNPVFNANLSGD